MLFLAFNILPVKSEPKTWIVDDDGPVDFHTIQEAINAANPGDTIFVRNGTFYERAVVNKTVSLFGENEETAVVDGGGVGNVIEVTTDNVIITGLTIRNSGDQWTDSGIALNQVKNCTIFKNNITENRGHGIRLYSSSRNRIINNSITANNWGGIWISTSADHNSVSGNNVTWNGRGGIWLDSSSNNSVTGNNIANNEDGMILCCPSNNSIIGNNIISNHHDGIRLYYSANNSIFHNNFVDNQQHVSTFMSYGNLWNDGYPSGGNYWSNYTGIDEKNGLNQDQLGSDGIGDTPHIIEANNTDNYPLMGLFSDFNATPEWHIQTICNSTISDFQFNGTAICFNVTGEDGTTGFCRICIPTSLMNGTYKVFVNGIEAPQTILSCSNMTHIYLYFIYNHSTREVAIIVPQFPSPNILIFIIATLLAVLTLIITTLAAIVYRRKHATVLVKNSPLQRKCL